MIGELAAIDWLMWLVRWVHAVGAVAWVGGSIFFAIVLRPVLAANPEVSRQLMGPVGSIYKELVDAAVLALIVSGLVLMFDRLTGNQVTPTWFIVLGIKLVLALWMFYLVWRFRRSGYQPTPGPGILRRASWLLGYNAIVAIGLVVFLLAGLLNTLFATTAAG